MKAVYTTTDLYILASWDDPTQSLARLPWEKQADGSWQVLENRDSSGEDGHENTYYEDKLAVQWDVNVTGFAATGCFANCHLDSIATSPTFPGLKYNAPGELSDLWHWKSVRTEPNGQVDDGYVAGLEEPGNGRKSDGSTSGGYRVNQFSENDEAPLTCPGDPDGSANLPCYMGPAGGEAVDGDQYWILEAEKQPFADSFEANDRIANIITSPFVGSRGDVSSRARWANGRWTIEIRRSLTTDTDADDVQFTDLTESYLFGVAVFDNTQINHAIHAGALELTFRP